MKASPFLTCFPYRLSPSAFFEGTHDVRFAWGNTDAIDFVAIASSLRATNGGRVVGNTNRLKAVPLVHGRKKSTLARSLVLSVKLDARYGHRLAIPIPSSNRHIQCISRLRISFRFIALNLSAIFERQTRKRPSNGNPNVLNRT